MNKINLDIVIVKMPLKSFKRNTSCVVGGVHADLLKSGTENLYELLRQIFERYINGEEIRNDWRIGNI
jgi:hypothetical protein